MPRHQTKYSKTRKGSILTRLPSFEGVIERENEIKTAMVLHLNFYIT
ncbi:unnamed protein product [Ilex paraguariensis]|uniref:Uncharacterized protein n=1 Tax=Ilex paraguariensis TaxID=185542 RepID=A0ABC8STI8_9AQUA